MNNYRIQKILRSNLDSSFNCGKGGREEGRLSSELAQVLIYIMPKGWVEEVSIIEKKGKRHENPGHACYEKKSY